jgi:uncharacterized protein YPO0396
MVPSVGVLHRTIETEAAAIRTRMGTVNAGLRRVEFNEGTRLQIAWTTRQFDSAREFRQVVDDLHRNAGAAQGAAEAALAQFSRIRTLMARFTPLMLDEAFSKSDETFASQALAAFDEFGFQLIMAAPIRMAGVLEPFIGQAVLVEKRITPDGARSAAASATFGQLATRRTAQEN